MELWRTDVKGDESNITMDDVGETEYGKTELIVNDSKE